MTVLLILVNMLVFWGPQRTEEKARDRAAAFYIASPLPAIEVPRFVAWLEKRATSICPRRARCKGGQPACAAGLDGARRRLSAAAAQPRFVPAERPPARGLDCSPRAVPIPPARPFTRHWAMDCNRDAEFRPITWLTATFLHSSTGHLLGNMLFLFLFGFSVELALGRTTYLAFYLLGGLGARPCRPGRMAAPAAMAWALRGGVCVDGHVCRAVPVAACAVFYQLFFYFNYVTARPCCCCPRGLPTSCCSTGSAAEAWPTWRTWVACSQGLR